MQYQSDDVDELRHHDSFPGRPVPGPRVPQANAERIG
jgi:hypothetical protein